MFQKGFFVFAVFLSIFSGCRGDNPGRSGKEYAVTTLVNLESSHNTALKENMIPEPAGITILGDNLFFTDSYNQTVGKIDMQTGKWEVIAGTYQVEGATDGPGKQAKFSSPFGLVNDGKFLYVADSKNSIIRKIDLRTYEVSTLMGKANVAGARDGDKSTGLLRHPYGLALDGQFLLVADSGNSTIRRINLKTEKIKTIAGISGVAGRFDGPMGTGKLNTPRGIAVDDRNIYVADTINGAIRKVDKKTGEITTLAGVPYRPGSADGKGSSASFNGPTSLAVLGNDLVIVDMQNHMVRKLDTGSTEVTTIAGKGNNTFALDILSFFPCIRAMSNKAQSGFADGNTSESRFNRPFGIYVDGAKIYISDTKNHAIRILQ